MKKPLRLGTRNSKLARWQTDRIVQLLQAADPDVNIEIIPITTTGDRITDRPLSQIGNQGLFTKEIENAILENRVDAGVHSLKDLESKLPDGLIIAAVPEREDVRDVLISKIAGSLEELPRDARIYTGSLRRKAMLLGLNSEFRIEDIRGNVDTRIRKFRESDFDGLIMAGAGLRRLGLSNEIGGYIPVKTILPAVGQGAMAVEIRANDDDAREIFSHINDESLHKTITAERSFMHTLQGGCRVPIAGYAQISDGALVLEGFLANLDCARSIRDSISGDIEDAENLGRELAGRFINNGGEEILAEFREMM